MKVVESREDHPRGPQEAELRPTRPAFGRRAEDHQGEREERAPGLDDLQAENRPAPIVQRRDRLRLFFLWLSVPLFLFPQDIDLPRVPCGWRAELEDLPDMESAQEAEAEAAAFKVQQPAHQPLWTQIDIRRAEASFVQDDVQPLQLPRLLVAALEVEEAVPEAEFQMSIEVPALDRGESLADLVVLHQAEIDGHAVLQGG